MRDTLPRTTLPDARRRLPGIEKLIGELLPAGIVEHAAFADVVVRLAGVLDFLHCRGHLSVEVAARSVDLPTATVWRWARRFLRHGVSALVPGKPVPTFTFTPGSCEDRAQRQTLSHLALYLLRRGKGFGRKQAAEGLPMTQKKLHTHAQRLLRHGIAGLAPDFRARMRCADELRRWQVGPEHLQRVEALAGACGSIETGWRRFGRSIACPFRLSVFIRKRKRLAGFLARSVSITSVPSRAARGGSGRIYVQAAGKFTILEPKTNAQN